MGIRLHCPNGHRLNVKAFLAGKRGICPKCGARFEIPLESEANHRAVAAPWTPSANPTMPGLPSANHAVADPIAEAPAAVWYVRSPAGAEYGPATGEAMRTWLAEGRVTSDSWVWRDGWPEWRHAATLFPQFMPKPVQPPVMMPGIAPPPAIVVQPQTPDPMSVPLGDPNGYTMEVDWTDSEAMIDTEPSDPLVVTASRHFAARENFRRNMLIMTSVLIASALILVVVAVYLVLVKQSGPPKPADDKPAPVSSSLEPQPKAP